MKKEKYRIIKKICFILYIITILYLLLLCERYGRTEGYCEYRMNLIPFQEINRFAGELRRFVLYRDGIYFEVSMLNLLGNILIFVPFGALLPCVTRKKIHWYQAICYSFLFSLFIECSQLFAKVGVFDVDDLILNTVGGLIGFWLYCIWIFLSRRVK